ncbi:nucleotidyltransferase family protein [Desulfitibacter alkalitolerans]|uniref:nucleotidyltransferase family protein n=1 Tax=Desulfitibacter alkalitolerans TaxID=264641 RepID=UPI00054CFB62|nr:nucleotidyltransferase family protein [Desulfitibacter alkalitolerans]
MLIADGSKLSCIVLAAGRSKRMGSNNKLLLPFHGKELILHTIEKIIGQDFFEIVIVTGWQSHELEKILMNYPVKLINHPGYLEGQSTSLKKGLSVISEKTLGAFFVLGDQPMVQEETIKRLIAGFLQKPSFLTAPYYKDKRGNPVIIPRQFFSWLNQLQGDQGARDLFLREEIINKIHVHDPGVVEDIDTPEDYEKLKTKQNILRG